MAAELGKSALDERVLRAMAKVPRHDFMPVEVHSYAYLNRPIPIGFDKTISQPLMVAVMTELLELKPDVIILEIGTGLCRWFNERSQVSGLCRTVSGPDPRAQGYRRHRQSSRAQATV
jgi:hypothetical protein